MNDTRQTWFPWPRAAILPLSGARLRVAPEDFIVEEDMPFELSGSGEHAWVKVRKRGFNTDQVAKHLARIAGVKPRDVGYAGMKDRHAVTVQWFSIQMPGRTDDPDWRAGLPQDVEVLETIHHSRKLKTGALEGNRFIITLRDVAGDRAACDRRLEEIRATGVPNYFGEQRFGRGGENVERAKAMFAGTFEVKERYLRGIYLSAARSLLFNDVLARRISDGSWQPGMPGEAFSLDGSRSFFVVDEIDTTIKERLARLDIHPSGPLWGRGELPSRGAARELETQVVGANPAIAEGLVAAGMEQERRPLRVIPKDLTVEWVDATTLKLSFALPAGAYATAVLRELAAYTDCGGTAI
jgi:tRNA pseudouridine13 synthase